MIRFICLFLLLSTAALADGFPAHFSVSDVSQDDRLNIRSAPNGSSDIIGDYGPYQLNIEVLRTSNDTLWGLVGVGERNGWVSMRYLERQKHLAVGEFPRPLSCFGTEPFWTLTVGVRGDEYTSLATARRDALELTSENVSNNGTDIFGGRAIFNASLGANHTLIFNCGYCNDGMSDREFGWSAMLFTQSPDGNSVSVGCCSMDFTR